MRGGLREVTFFWQIERLQLRSEMIPLLNLCESMTILGVIEQSPESLVLTTRINTKEGKTIDDLQRLGFFSVRELLSEPSSSDEGYVLSIDLNPKLAEFIVRRPTCSIRPGSRSRGSAHVTAGLADARWGWRTGQHGIAHSTVATPPKRQSRTGPIPCRCNSRCTYAGEYTFRTLHSPGQHRG